MSSSVHVLVKGQELSQMSTVDDIFASWDLVCDLLALTKGSSAVGFVCRSLAHPAIGQSIDQGKFQAV